MPFLKKFSGTLTTPRKKRRIGAAVSGRISTLQYVVVGGGGAGGFSDAIGPSWDHGGGGGAGGFRYGSISIGSSFDVTIGAGGTPGSTGGGSSSLDPGGGGVITSAGGGAATSGNGQQAGSGGGA
jgi:hypothetical protein